MAAERVLYRLAWGNPYTQPPDNLPRVVATEIGRRGPDGFPGIAALCAASPRFGLGSGYSVHFYGAIDEKPPRRLSGEARQSIRRKALRRRQERNNPLFAEVAIEAAQARNPEYYGTEKA